MKCLTLAAILATLGAARSAAQVVVRDTTVATGDSLVVHFPDATRYLVEVDQPLTTFSAHAIARAGDPVLSTRAVAWEPGSSAQYEVYPRWAGDYLIRFTRSTAGTTVHFRITRVPATPIVSKPRSRYRLGFVVAAGMQRAQYLESAECDACTDPDPAHLRPDEFYRWGREFEIQVVLGSAGPWSLGIGATQTHRTNRPYGYSTTIFLEPKWMPLALSPFGVTTEAGLALRVGLISARNLPTNPIITSPGLLLRQHLDHRRGTEGWTLSAGAYLNVVWIHKQGDDLFGPLPQVGTQVDPRFTIQLGFAP
ncbi:MAG: hypothetical protein V4558_05150 [Gemmatimonadota bacterium]